MARRRQPGPARVIGAAPQLYLRRCNGQPADGVEVDRDTVEFVLSLAHMAQGVTAVAIRGDLESGLTIRIPAGPSWAVEAPGTVEREFTYEPVPAGRRTSIRSLRNLAETPPEER